MIILPSLEIVPAKYNGSTLLSQIPIDGTGDFAVTRATSPTTNRSTRVNALGQIELVADNVPRLDYPIGGGCPALLVEPAATNGIRNNSMVGAVTGSPGTAPTNWIVGGAGLTQQIVAVGTENGVSYIDLRLSGTATASTATLSFESATQIAALTGQTWTISSYLKTISLPSPPSSFALAITERTSGGAIVVQQTTNVSLTSNLARYTYSPTLNGGATTAFAQPRLFFVLVVGQTYDFTVRVGYPQMELGSVATSVIPTTTQAITRAADVITDATASGVIGQTQGTIYAEFEHTSNTAERRLIALSDGNVTNRIFIWAESNILYAQIQGNSLTIVNPIPSGYNKIAFAYQQNGVSGNLFASINGGAVVSGTSTTYPSTLSRVAIGSSENAAAAVFQWNNRIRAAALYPTRLTNTQLALLTSPYTSYSSMASALSYTLG